MADVIKKTTNRWTKGLVMDFSPENTKNEVLTNALNATLLTFNGNELSLQNDMGNGRVETAYLPEGYIPVGTCEYGGIIYIVSYNPLEDKSQIGCFPSPERVISRDELGLSDNVTISTQDFQELVGGKLTGKINHNTRYVLLKNSNLNPGDKFVIYADNIYNEKLKDLYKEENPISNPILSLNIVSIEDSGKIVYLNSTVKQYKKNGYSYHILQSDLNNDSYLKQDIDSYRNVLSSGYSVFKSKTSGKLAILAELIMVDSYSVTHRLESQKDENNKIKEGIFDIVLHTEVAPEITKENYRTVPKLQYYYLKNSQGYLQTGTETITLFNNNIINNSINSTKLSDLYEPIDNNIINDLETALNTSDFKFPKASTYHSILKNYEGNFNEITNEIYTKFIKDKYHRIDITQIKDEQYFISKEAKFYYYNEFDDSYLLFTEDTLIDKYEYYIKHNNNIYNDVKRDTKYQGQILYKIKNEIRNADTSIIEDPQIEKYKEYKIYIYREATSNDVNQKLYYTTNGGHTYNELVGDKESGVTYYTLTVESNYVSVGNVINNPTGIYYYYPGTTDYIEASYEEIIDYFDFTKFPYQQEAPYGSPLTLYYKTTEEVYEKASEENLKDFNKPGMVLYYKTNYFLISNLNDYNEDNQVFILFKNNTLIPLDKFKPHTDYNYINGNTVNQIYPNESPIYVYTTEWGEYQNTESMTYEDVILATIKLPDVVVNNALDLPFKYDYTIVPCMNYGRLDHLAVSNTVDFSKLHAFNQSDFTTWKYRIDDNQLRLTFGAEIYDTYETNKVDGLILEFYDCQGFVGSLEIVDKKSYSGIFTKIIPLNSLGVLNNKMIDENYERVEGKPRNINIPLNKEPASHESYLEQNELQNDIGTLYSNLIYGVKTYLRRQNQDTIEYIKKRDFYLYTLPIYNDYYFTVNNFNDLTNPELNFVLTYKLKDSGSKQVFTNDIINGGYNEQDKASIDSYLRGFYKEKSLDITKYYKYKGITDLYLEIGLEKTYEELNLRYDPAINSLFSCDLKLVSDDDANVTYKVNSNVEGLVGDQAILNYKNILSSSLNVLDFANKTSNEEYLKVSSLTDHMFINIEETKTYTPIKINYEFVVGYNAHVTNIKETQVQATTVCALCHKKQDTEEYNYEDFGVYEKEGVFYSKAMFYNGGTAYESEFGICRQINTEGNVSTQCQKGPIVKTETQAISTQGKLNTGEPLKQIISNVGKLTFCQPHVHSLTEGFGVNIHGGGSPANYGISPHIGGFKLDGFDSADKTMGIAATSFLFEKPKYNLCVNTPDTINYFGVFISAIDYHEIQSTLYLVNTNTAEGDAHGWTGNCTTREFTGFTGEEVTTFNKKMVETFKNVYAYNPDYDSLTVNKGSVTLQDYNPFFTSNLISTNSELKLETVGKLNDYIYFGNTKVSEYLNYLKNRASFEIYNDDNSFIPQLQFTANLEYCGRPNSNYLISSLTYNTLVPTEIEQELEFSSSNLTVIKHENGNNTFIEGVPNKKTLYGYVADINKLVQLDVSNYTIDEDGVLTMLDVGVIETGKPINNSVNIQTQSQLGGYNFDYTFTNTKEENTNLKIGLTLNYSSLASCQLYNFYQFRDNIIMAIKINKSYDGFNGGMTITPSLRVISSDSTKYSYKVNLDKAELSLKWVVLNNKLDLNSYTYDKIPLQDQSLETIKQLLQRQGTVTLTGHSSTETNSVYNYIYDVDTLGSMNINNSYISQGWGNEEFDANTTIKFNDYKEINLNYSEGNRQNQDYIILLLSFKVDSIDFSITEESSLKNIEENFIKTTRTKDYSEMVEKNHKYQVKSKYKDACLRETSITLNDLEYQNNKDGHRLFIRDGLYNYDDNLRGKLYYRGTNRDDSTVRGSWIYENTKNLNTLFLYTGPCFTKDSWS